MDDLAYLPITEALKKLDTGEITSLDLVRACKKNIDARNASLNAYLEVFSDIEDQAKAADERRAKGQRGVLLGIPLAIKDNILIEGKISSASSKMLENYTAAYDATVIKKLKEAGAVFMGRTNMDEFALGGSTENSAFGVTKNPHDESRVAGGTSGGSAAAVAAGMALGALGTDTGGSVRNPASFCGVVGLKPTYGAVSRFGLIAAVSSFDQAGPITRTAEDAKIIFDVIRGTDPLDSTTISKDTYAPHKPTKKIGVFDLATVGSEGKIDEELMRLYQESQKKLEKGGYELVTIDVSALKYALSMYYIVNFAEVSSNLARFDGVRYGLSKKGENLFDDYALSKAEGFGPETRRRIILGTYVLSAGYYDAYYGKALAAREELRREYMKAFESVDFIMTPTMPMPAWKIGEKSDPLSAYLADIFTVVANLTGNPAISIPAGTVEREGKHLPVGIQFTAAHGDEASLSSVATDLE